MGIQHQQVQSFFAFLRVDGGDQHTAGIDAHHGTGRQVGDGHTGLAHQFLRLIVVVNAAQNDAVGTGSVIQHELQQLLALLDGLTLLDLHGTEIALGEGVKVHKVGEQRLNLHLGEVDLLRHNGRDRSSLGGLLRLLVTVQRLHGGDFRDQP